MQKNSYKMCRRSIKNLSGNKTLSLDRTNKKRISPNNYYENRYRWYENVKEEAMLNYR